MADSKEHSLEDTGVSYEIYLNDADKTPAEELLTQIVYPIR